ncbi:MAG: valine--tRNA ligase [Bacteroidia bacterium]|nr:valine--tRNA ligase [Bacteroidia bacterium]
MEIAKTYNPAQVEEKWYKYWESKGYFYAKVNPNKKPYTIVIPPPNVTGVLHMGHMLNNTIQDILIRRARMKGFETCWVPGTDHASIATEAKVVEMLAKQGISKKSLTREQFLKYAWEWTEKYGGIILQQLRKLGASCDWKRTRFTMEEDLSQAVIDVFCDLYEKGLIYRGTYVVNWDPKAETTVSDEEVIYEEVQSKLYYIKYFSVDNPNEYLVIATVRPETIMGDVAIAVHPQDERYQAWIGRKVYVPLINRPIPVIADNSIDKEFGTGCLKVTPAHDPLDYEIGKRHNLPIIDTIAPNGTMSEAAQIYVGEDRFVVRKKIAQELQEKGHIQEIKEYKNRIGLSERTKVPIEPKISMQWFVKMKPLAQKALEAVEKGEVKLYPSKFVNLYKVWMENVKDWCISRQLWWGQRIPAYYLPDGNMVVARNIQEALKKAQQINPDFTEKDLKQDEDVVDTWFSSWLWPISVFDGFKDPDNPDFKYFYPTNDLVTAPEILFFWVARMIMAGLEFKGQVPFRNVYLTGIVRDGEGRKMSKSLGNSPEPLELIEKFSADGVRVGMLFSSPAGNDLKFPIEYQRDAQGKLVKDAEGRPIAVGYPLMEQGRNMANKIWNAYRLTQSWKIDTSLKPCEYEQIAMQWIQARLNEAAAEIEQHFDNFRIVDALMTLYKLIWDDFCSTYLEWIKPIQNNLLSQTVYNHTIEIFKHILILLHPFMPFITEELWHSIQENPETDLIVTPYYTAQPLSESDKALLEDISFVLQIVTELRNVRNTHKLSSKENWTIYLTPVHQPFWAKYKSSIEKLLKFEKEKGIDLQFTTQKVQNTLPILVRTMELLVQLHGSLDIQAEKAKLEKELAHLQNFLKTIEAKLNNEKFMANAKPDVIQNERKKHQDTLQKIKLLQERLSGLR